jgi:hypothetical protein
MEEENISPSSNKSNKNITLEDIKIFYKDRFVDFTNLPISRYNLITNINISENLNFLGKIDSNDIWLHTESNIYLCGLPNSPTRSWYKIKDISDIDTFQDFYEKTIIKEPSNVLRFGIKFDKMNFTEFIQYIYFNQFTEKNICESQRDLNYSIKDNLITLEDQIRIYNNFLKSNNKNFYIRTKYSKSIIYIETYDEYSIVNILYNELKLKNRYDKYPAYLPSDISIIFNSLNKIFYLDVIDLIQKEKINEIKFNEIKLHEMKIYIDILFKTGETTKIKKDLGMKNIVSNELKQYIKEKFIFCDSDIVFNKIEKDGIIKAFENSLDILIQTFYEKINQNENIDSLYLTQKLKNKINEIFKTKLI